MFSPSPSHSTVSSLSLAPAQSSNHIPSRSMVCIRKAMGDNLLAMQACNLFYLPENYQIK
ncbi:hypothetical protein HN51_008853 [Arachis hypogaea]